MSLTRPISRTTSRLRLTHPTMASSIGTLHLHLVLSLLMQIRCHLPNIVSCQLSSRASQPHQSHVTSPSSLCLLFLIWCHCSGNGIVRKGLFSCPPPGDPAPIPTPTPLPDFRCDVYFCYNTVENITTLNVASTGPYPGGRVLMTQWGRVTSFTVPGNLFIDGDRGQSLQYLANYSHSPLIIEGPTTSKLCAFRVFADAFITLRQSEHDEGDREYGTRATPRAN